MHIHTCMLTMHMCAHGHICILLHICAHRPTHTDMLTSLCVHLITHLHVCAYHPTCTHSCLLTCAHVCAWSQYTHIPTWSHIPMQLRVHLYLCSQVCRCIPMCTHALWLTHTEHLVGHVIRTDTFTCDCLHAHTQQAYTQSQLSHTCTYLLALTPRHIRTRDPRAHSHMLTHGRSVLDPGSCLLWTQSCCPREIWEDSRKTRSRAPTTAQARPPRRGAHSVPATLECSLPVSTPSFWTLSASLRRADG